MFHVFVDGQAYGPYNKVRAFVLQHSCVLRCHERLLWCVADTVLATARGRGAADPQVPHVLPGGQPGVIYLTVALCNESSQQRSRSLSRAVSTTSNLAAAATAASRCSNCSSRCVIAASRCATDTSCSSS